MTFFRSDKYNLAAEAIEKGLDVVGPFVKPSMIWVDIETTGLTPGEDIILEYGMVMTTEKAEVIEGSAFHAYLDIGLGTFAKIDDFRESVEPFVRDMHDKSALWSDLETAAEMEVTVTPDELQDDILEYFAGRALPKNVFPMCGSSVDFDRGFVKSFMVEIYSTTQDAEPFFHYRVIDTSTLKGIAALVNKRVANSLPEKTNAHRVMPDLLDTLSEYKHYLDNLIITDWNS